LRCSLLFLVRFVAASSIAVCAWEAISNAYLRPVIPVVNWLLTQQDLPLHLEQRRDLLLYVYEPVVGGLRLQALDYDSVYLNLIAVRFAGLSAPTSPYSGAMVNDFHTETARSASLSYFLPPWLWIAVVGLLLPCMSAAQNDSFTQNEAGLTGITQVQFGNEIQIYAFEVIDAADPGITVELGKISGGVVGVQLTISDLTTTTGLVSADFTNLRLYRSLDLFLDGTDTFMASASPVNIGAITEIDPTLAGASRLVPEAGSAFFVVSARISPAATGGHAFRVGTTNLNIGVEESGVGSDPNIIGNQVLADNASHIVLGGGPAKKAGGGGAVTIPFGGEKAMLFLLVSSGAYALRRRSSPRYPAHADSTPPPPDPTG
jgi:hypothetical protein